MSTHVFLGPSLPLEQARQILPDAVYHPPAAIGDIYRAATAGHASLICLIDGLFERVPAVWHKEILYCLEQGIRVVGSSSMGALRARELHVFGMEGVGRVFEAYRDDELEDDDEVALAHGPAEFGYQNLSVAMVNIREALRNAERDEVIDADAHAQILALAKSSFYPERTWPNLQKLATEAGLDGEMLARLADYAGDERHDLKRADARQALRLLADGTEPRQASAKPRVQLERTAFWHRLVDTATQPAGGGGGELRAEHLRHHVRLHARDSEALSRELLLEYLIESEAKRIGLVPAKASLQAALNEIRRQHGLLSAEATDQWLRSNHMSKADLADLANRKAVAAELISIHREQLDLLIPMVLEREGKLGEVTSAAQKKRNLLRELGIGDNPTLADAEVTEAELMAWYLETFRPVYEPLEAHSKRLGFPSLRELFNEMLAEYIYAKETAGQDCAE